jgi:hypothetical protein
MRWHIECKYSGKGETVSCSFAEAVRLAWAQCQTDKSCFVIWAEPSHIRVGELTLRGLRWLKSSLSSSDVKSLMRKHKWTIGSLAFRLGLSKTRVRQVRDRGLNDPLAVRDWIQALTGDDVGPIPEKYWMRHHTQEASCAQCGYPMDVGDYAYMYLNEVFCSIACCRLSRGWGNESVA